MENKYKKLIEYLWEDFESQKKLYMEDSEVFVRLCLEFGIEDIKDNFGYFDGWLKKIRGNKNA